jgi:phosphatidylglycerol:prolipoprotein diacylglycerol transferase
MHPELLKIPFIPGLTIKSYGTLMVIGFLAAVYVLRRLGRREGIDPILITNTALYSLIAGIVGARIFYVLHYPEQFRGDWLAVFKIWHGGLEFLGGVLLALATMVAYLAYCKLPVRRTLDILAIGLMVGLGFGRIGCFLNGCCYGRPADLPWAVRFPYDSFAYVSQINPSPERGRAEPELNLPKGEYFDFNDEYGKWHPKPLSALTDQERYEVTQGKWRCLAVQPSQLYGSANGFLLALVLYLFWNHACALRQAGRGGHWLARPGQTAGLMFVLYGIARFLLEFTRDDNPFEWASLTISQILGMALVVVGIGMIVAFARIRPDRTAGSVKHQ